MLTLYTAWANDRLSAALAALPDGEATARRTTGFGSMVNTLNHAYVVNLIWQVHLQASRKAPPHSASPALAAQIKR